MSKTNLALVSEITELNEVTSLKEKAMEVKDQINKANSALIEDFDEVQSTNTVGPEFEKRDILRLRDYYKPFEYPQFFEYFKLQQQAHWLPTEVPMADDLVDFKTKLTAQESNLIIQVLRFFTQGDLEVQNNYNSQLVTVFPKPEITMMLTAFAAMETVHVWAYSHLNDTLGLPDVEYKAFREYEAMKNKYEYLQNLKIDTEEDIAYNLACFGGFMEGVSLFASFAILMNFPRRGLLKNVGQIITWSIRDESLHSEGVCALFREYISERPYLWTEAFRDKLYQACEDMVNLEDNFIDTCFALGAVEGLKPEDVKKYIRYVANKRLGDLNLDPKYDISENPLPWLNLMVNGKEHANFFETRATEYAKGAIVDDWE
jgi:ribonucleoside-diphosphate reductase beta chain